PCGPVALLRARDRVACKACFVAAVFALVAGGKPRAEELARQGTRGAAAVRDAVGPLDHSIAATQLGITLASLALGWLGEPALAPLGEPLFAAPAAPPAPLAAHPAARAPAFALLPLIHR